MGLYGNLAKNCSSRQVSILNGKGSQVILRISALNFTKLEHEFGKCCHITYSYVAKRMQVYES